ncbi:MAG: HDOD domain-containing protein [Wenzhouxiangellaceae bacterium]|nr:HDOD domain-containing protein [Wenzhouxiangellaceae bacterium]
MNESRNPDRDTEVAPDRQTGRALFARQPIYDHTLRTIGYELLFRETGDHRGMTATASDPQAARVATARVMINTVLDLDLTRLAEDKILFFNLSRDFLVAGIELPFQGSRIGVDVLPGPQPIAEVLPALEALALDGIVIAIDDFAWDEDAEKLLEVANIAKVGITDRSENELRELVRDLKAFNVKTAAKFIEHSEQFELCKDIGFDYFQGFFLSKPKLVKATHIPASRANLLRLIAKLEDPSVSPDQLEDIIRFDMALHYRLLRTVNSAYYGLSIKIRSISHAVVYLGIPTVKRWTQLQMLASSDEQPGEIIKQTLIRARMCELLTANLSRETRHIAFTVGMFSMLDAILGLPLDELLPKLPLENDVVNALLQYEGPYGRLLETVVRYEHGQWDEVAEGLYSAENLSQAYMDALFWANDQYAALTEEDS